MTRLKEQVAIVTGAAQGIGRSFALGLAAEGARVVAVDVQDEETKNVVDEIAQAGGEAIAVHTDVHSRGQLVLFEQALQFRLCREHLRFHRSSHSIAPGEDPDRSIGTVWLLRRSTDR